MDLREYIKTYYIDKIKNVRDNVKIKDVNLTCEKNKHPHLLNITYTSRNVTESHQLLLLITMLMLKIAHYPTIVVIPPMPYKVSRVGII